MTAAGWIVGTLWTLAVLGLIVAAMYWFNRSTRSGAGDAPGQEPSARDILDRRLAEDELTLEGYRELRAAIETPESASRGGVQSEPSAGVPG